MEADSSRCVRRSHAPPQIQAFFAQSLDSTSGTELHPPTSRQHRGMSYTGLSNTPSASAEQDEHSELEGSAGSEDGGFVPVTASTGQDRGVRLRLPLFLLCCLASLVVYVSNITAFGKMEVDGVGPSERSELMSLSESLQSAKALVTNAIIEASKKKGPHDLRELDPLPTILAAPWIHSCTRMVHYITKLPHEYVTIFFCYSAIDSETA